MLLTFIIADYHFAELTGNFKKRTVLIELPPHIMHDLQLKEVGTKWDEKQQKQVPVYESFHEVIIEP